MISFTFLIVLTSLATYSLNISLTKSFFHRIELNHAHETNNLALQIKDVLSRGDCATKCTGNVSLLSRDAMKDTPHWTCQPGHHSLIACSTTSCFLQGALMSFTFFCTKTLFQAAPAFVSVSGAKRHDVLLKPFYLQRGQVISLHVTGSPHTRWGENIDDRELPYRLRLKWYQNKAEFATRPRDKEANLEVTENPPVSSRVSNYSLDIHIKDTEFKTYIDGRLVMTNRMSLPFTDVSRVVLYGFKAVHKFKIGEDNC